jgi:hypothetical protein
MNDNVAQQISHSLKDIANTLRFILAELQKRKP